MELVSKYVSNHESKEGKQKIIATVRKAIKITKSVILSNGISH